MNCGYTIGNPAYRHPAELRREREPSSRACRRRRATLPGSRRGSAFPSREIAIHALSRWRNTGDRRTGSTDDHSLCVARPPERKTRSRFCSRPRHCGAAAPSGSILLAPYLCYMRQDTAFHEGEAISQKVVGALIARMRRSRDHRRRAFASDAGHRSRIPGNRVRQSLGNAGNRGRAAQNRPSIQQPSSSGRTPESQPWVSDLAGRLGLSSYRRDKRPAAATAPSKSNSRSPTRIAGRPALIVDDIVSSGGTMIACARALDVGRRDHDRRRRHPRAVP